MPSYSEVEKVLAVLRRVLRMRGYSLRTEESYLGSVRRFLRFHRRVSPGDLQAEHLERYLEYLAEDLRLAPASRNLAASGISFFFMHYLGSDAGRRVPRARQGEVVPVVFSHSEAIAVIELMRGKYRLIGRLLYGSGIRVSECLSLRVKDLDFDLAQITVRDGKGARDRYTVLPRSLIDPLRNVVQHVAEVRARDRGHGGGWAALPGALHQKAPRAGFDLSWHFLFPASRETPDEATGRLGRWHLHVTAVQREVKRAIRSAGISKPATTHTFRHTFATETLRSGYDVRTVQKLMGHKDIRITMRYLHAIEQTGLAVRSPLDRSTSGD